MAREREKYDAESGLAKIVVASLEREKSELETKAESLMSHFREFSLDLWSTYQDRARLVLKSLTIGLNTLMILALALGAVIGTDAIQAHWSLKALVAVLVGLILLYLSKDWVGRFLREKVERLYRRKYKKRVNKIAGTVAPEVLVSEPFLGHPS